MKGSPMYRFTRISVVTAALLATICLTGCTASVLERREPGPTDVAQPLVTLPTEKVTPVEIPKDMYYAGFDDSIRRFDGKPKAAWLVRGKSLLVTSYAQSGDCGQRPSTIKVLSDTEIIVSYSRVTAVACSAVLYVGSEAIALPADVTGRPVTVTLDVSGEEPASDLPTFELD